MAIIPRYTSRALPPGAQPGLITGARSRGEAGAGLARAFGGAVVEGIDYARRRDLAAETAAKTTAAAKFAERIAAEKRRNENLDHRNGETTLAAAEAEITKGRARAVASAKTGGAPARDMARISLADFDDTTRKQAEALKTRPHLKARFDAMVESSRAPHELRMLTLENERRAGEEKAVLAAALAGLAQAATDDPAMAPGVTGRGLAQIEAAMEAGMVTPEEAAAMQSEFAENVHMSAMRGQIAADPALALEKLESGELDDIFEAPARDHLLGEARTTARVKQAGESAAARARRRGLEIDMEEHLAALDETGAADNAVAARARAELPDIQYAAFQANQAQARERHATRAEYAFMTAQEIEIDIAANAPGGILSDSDERDAAHTIRAEIRDEVLAARATDPAGWAMRDADVAAAFTVAQENSDDPASARKALTLRLALQREMGIEPRLLSEAERDAIAGELQALPPVERLTRLGELKHRYGDQFDLQRKELGGDIDGATARLALFADRPLLAGLLAKGIGKAQRNGLAKSDGPLPPAVFIHADKDGPKRFDIGRLGKEYGIGQVFILPDGSRVLYDGEALVPMNADIPVTLASATDPATDPNAPTPPIPLGKKNPPPETSGGDAESEHVTSPSAPEEGEGLSGVGGEQSRGGRDSAEPNEAPVDLETEEISLPTGEEEGDGGSAEEAGGQGPGGGASAGPNEAHDFHPETKRLDTEQPSVATDRQPSPQDGESSGRAVSEPHSEPGTNSDTNAKSVDGLQGREPENPSAAVDNTKKGPAVEWASVRNLVTSKETFKTNGPVKIELNSMTLGLDGLRYTVDWHPLDKNGNRAAAVQAEDYRPPEYGGHVLPGVPSETIIEPPYDNPYGFEVTVKVPPQERYSDNSSGPYLNIYQLK